MPTRKVKSTEVVKKLMKAGVPLVALKARRLRPGTGNAPSHSIYVEMAEKPTPTKVYKLLEALKDFARVKIRKSRYDYQNDLYRIYFHTWTDYQPGKK